MAEYSSDDAELWLNGKKIGKLPNVALQLETANEQMKQLGRVMWSVALTEEFGEHPRRIFHAGP
jgi:hypothetical protein